MAYASWSVVFGEQPSASKWNILGTNDASFNDGSGIASLAWNTTALSNPYKFHAYKSGAQNWSTSGSQVTYETEEFDTNGNFASSVYTCPVAGFYLFGAALGYSATGSTTRALLDLRKNGVAIKRGDDRSVVALTGAATVTVVAQFAATNTVDIFATSVGANPPMQVNQATSFFYGILLSRT